MRVTLSARAVVAVGEPFVERADAFASAGAALDEIRWLEAPAEPTVIRAIARGGSRAEKAAVAGDWLFDRSLAGAARVPPPRWSHDRASLAWCRGRTWLDAWESCPVPAWMIDAVTRAVEVPRRFSVMAAASCAEAVSGAAGSESAGRAVDAAKAWADGRASGLRARDAARRVMQDRDGLTQLRRAAAVTELEFRVRFDALSAAYYAAYGAYTAERYPTGSYSDDLLFSVTSAIDAAREASIGAGRPARLADVVRSKVPTVEVLLAAVAADRPPGP